MWLAPARSSLWEVRGKDLGGSMEDWEWFVQDTRQHYNVDMSVLSQSYQEEQHKYFLQVSKAARWYAVMLPGGVAQVLPPGPPALHANSPSTSWALWALRTSSVSCPPWSAVQVPDGALPSLAVQSRQCPFRL